MGVERYHQKGMEGLLAGMTDKRKDQHVPPHLEVLTGFSLIYSGRQLLCLPLLHRLSTDPCGPSYNAASACAVEEGF